MQASQRDSQSFHHRLANLLLRYRSSPHSTTNRSPCTLFLQREIRTRFDLIKPESETNVIDKQACQKKDHDRHSKLRTLNVGDTVVARNYRPGPKWLPAVVVECKGPLSYVVQLESGMLWRRHIDQLQVTGDCPTDVSAPKANQESLLMDDGDTSPEVLNDSPSEIPNSSPSTESSNPGGETVAGEHSPTTENSSDSTTPRRRYPQRERRPPVRF